MLSKLERELFSEFSYAREEYLRLYAALGKFDYLVCIQETRKCILWDLIEQCELVPEYFKWKDEIRCKEKTLE